jgi:hypothetical protein
MELPIANNFRFFYFYFQRLLTNQQKIGEASRLTFEANYLSINYPGKERAVKQHTTTIQVRVGDRHKPRQRCKPTFVTVFAPVFLLTLSRAAGGPHSEKLRSI